MNRFCLPVGSVVSELVLHSLSPDLVADGVFGSGTRKAIEAFQKNVMGMKKPDGRIDPDKSTEQALKACMSSELTATKLQAIFINAPQSRIDTFYPHLMPMLLKAQITSPQRIAHFLAQIGHESGELRYTEEIANGSAYEGRKDLGNINQGDGAKFKGRGLIQITGRTNYISYGDARGTDYVTGNTGKQIATDPRLAIDVACWFWNQRKLNGYADTDNINKITRLINGGTNGLADRVQKLERAKFFLNVQ